MGALSSRLIAAAVIGCTGIGCSTSSGNAAAPDASGPDTSLPADAPSPDTVAPETDWPMYGKDLHHSFTQTSSTINASNVASLHTAWTFMTADAVSATPSVTGGVVYVGSWDGFFYALDAATGSVKWKLQLDCQPGLLPIPTQCLAKGQTEPDRSGTDGGIVTSSATVVGGRVYFGGGRTLYCLDAGTGAVIWKHVVCGNPDDAACATDASDPTNIFSSPVVVDGKVIVGHTVDGAKAYRGGIVAVDATSGAVVWSLEIDPKLDAMGNPILGADGLPSGGVNRGCGSVWSSGAVDENQNAVFFGTGDCQSDATPPYHEAILALDIATGHVKWAYRPRQTDTCDFDFGASANVMDIGGQRYVGLGGKDGTYYELVAASTKPAGQLAWSKNVVFGGSSGGFIGTAAFDGMHIVGGTGFGDLGSALCMPNNPLDMNVEDPSFHALDPATGKVLWEISKAYTFAASTIVNGVVFSGVGSLLPGALRAYSLADGTSLASFPQKGAVNSAAAVVGGVAYFGTGNSFDGSGGGVVALSL